MRNFNWDAIPLHSVVGKHNVWTARRSLEDFALDTQRIEELFSHSEEQRVSRRGSRTVKKSVWGLPESCPDPVTVSIINSKKSMNIGIFLKQFKRPMQDIVEDVRQGNTSFAPGRLKELSKLLPDDVELKKLSAFSGDVLRLAEADRFLLMLVKVPGYEERLKNLLLREEFFPFVEEARNSVAVMTAAANELLACDDLHSIIHLVLKAGNYMNAGGYAGRALGFRMTSLLRLVDTKANKPGMNLMHYVAMQAQQIDRGLLNFARQLRHIGEASRIHKQEVEMDIRREMEKIKEAKASTSRQHDLQHQMEDFLQVAESILVDMETSLRELDSLSGTVAEYFCEEPSTFKLEECCFIFHSFCEKFERAVQENGEREALERRRRQRREKEALERVAKRRSIATCSVRDTGSAAEGSALETILTSFLSERAPRRRQPSANRQSPAKAESSGLALRSPAKAGEAELVLIGQQLLEVEQSCGSKAEKVEVGMLHGEQLQEVEQSCWPKVDEDETDLNGQLLLDVEQSCGSKVEEAEFSVLHGKQLREVEQSCGSKVEKIEVGILHGEQLQEVEQSCWPKVDEDETDLNGQLLLDVEQSCGSKVEEAESVLNGQQLQEVEQSCQTEEDQLGASESHQSPAVLRRAPSIEDKVTPKRSAFKTRYCRRAVLRQASVVSEEGPCEMSSNQEEEEDEAAVVSPRRTVVRGPNGDPKLQSAPDAVSSPFPREADTGLQGGCSDMGSPWTVLSPHISSPSLVRRRRRHSFSSSAFDDEPDDGVWALPDTPVRARPPLLPFTCRSYEHSLSTSSPLYGRTSSRTPAQGPLLRSVSVGEGPDHPSFRFGAIFPRRHGQEPAVTKRQEPSALVTFFRRFGERGRPASVGEAHRTKT